MLLTLLAAQAVAAGPPAPVKPRPKVSSAAAQQACTTTVPTEPGVVVVCAVRPQGYRLDPDVTKARKEARNHTLPRGRELLRDTNCSTVGAAGCMNQPSINVLAAASTAVAMVRTAVSGGNVGKMFVTDPQMSEYDYYLAAKQQRQETEDEAADQAAVAAATRPDAGASR